MLQQLSTACNVNHLLQVLLDHPLILRVAILEVKDVHDEAELGHQEVQALHHLVWVLYR